MTVKSGLEAFTTHHDIEVQERAAEFLVLLSFVEADLGVHVPPKTNGSSDGLGPNLEGGFEEKANGDPPYPKSLFLFQPLFTSHELNAVAYKAQDAVRIPEESEEEKGLDVGEGGGSGMEELRRVLREQDEQEKKKGRKSKGKGKKADGEVMTVEEREEKERVSVGSNS